MVIPARLAAPCPISNGRIKSFGCMLSRIGDVLQLHNGQPLQTMRNLRRVRLSRQIRVFDQDVQRGPGSRLFHGLWRT